MNHAPLVSVVMINYNREPFMGAAIESVCVQTTGEWELIVVENGSKDGSLAIAERWAKSDPRIRLIPLPGRVPIPVAANRGIKEASGEYIARLDSDDVWLPERLSVQLEWLGKSGHARVGVCGAQCELINAEGNKIGEKFFPESHAECVRAFWFRNPFCQSAVLIRGECFRQFGLYDETFAVAEDLELWMRLAQGFQLSNLPTVLVRQRLWDRSVCMRQFRATVDATLRARRLAAKQFGHRRGKGAWLFYGVTWCARWCPPRWARWFFYNAFLRCGRRLWAEGNARSSAGGRAGKELVSGRCCSRSVR